PPRRPRRRDRRLHLRGPSLMRLGEHVAMTMGHDDVDRPAGVDVLAADDEGNLELAAGELFQSPLELRPLRGPRGVAQHRLVDGRGDLGNAVHGEESNREGRAVARLAPPGQVSVTCARIFSMTPALLALAAGLLP